MLEWCWFSVRSGPTLAAGTSITQVNVDEIIRVQVMSERDARKGNLEWAGIMQECKGELLCGPQNGPSY